MIEEGKAMLIKFLDGPKWIATTLEGRNNIQNNLHKL